MKRFVVVLGVVLSSTVLVAAAPPPGSIGPAPVRAPAGCTPAAVRATASRPPGYAQNAAIDLRDTSLGSLTAISSHSHGVGDVAVLRDGGDGPGALSLALEALPDDGANGRTEVHTAAVGVHPVAVAESGNTYFVANAGSCSISVVESDGVAVRTTATIDLAGSPTSVAIGFGNQLFVAEPLAGQVEVFADADHDYARLATLRTGGRPERLVGGGTGSGTGFVWALLAGGGAAGGIAVIDAGAEPPKIASTAAADDPVWCVDDGWQVLHCVERGGGAFATYAYDYDGALSGRSAVPIAVEPRPGVAPSSVRLTGAVYQEGEGIWDRTVTLAYAGADSFLVYRLPPADATGGNPTLAATLPGIFDVRSLMVDPAGTGRIFAVDGAGALISLRLGDSFPTSRGTADASPPPSLAYVLPGPLDVSLAPQDVARSAGIVVLIMLLLGAPTPLFNSTLAANRRLIERWLRRKRPRALRSAGGGTAGRAAGAVGRGLAALSRTWPGLVVYLGLAALIYAFLDPGFPGPDAPRILGMTAVAIGVATAVSQLPHEVYVRQRFGSGGRVHVALWTLVIAAACAVTTRASGVQPGYVYGIIGGFAFSVVLSREDRGRMTFRGMLILVAVGFAAWLARVPFQPGSPLGGGNGALVNDQLAGVFVNAVEASAIGLIPLRFLDGESLFVWSRPRWAILWGLGLFLFAHVILYPVSSYEPDPSATGLWTVAAGVGLYGSMAIGFWWFFKRRERRRRPHQPRAATAAA